MSFNSLFQRAKAKQVQLVQDKEQPSPKTTTKGETRLKRSTSRKTSLDTTSSPSQRKRKRNHKQRSEQPSKKKPPSQSAIDLSRQLQALSRQKRLQEAIDLYRKSSIKDEHHACIVIDCCGRCGAMDQAEEIAYELETRNVHTQTALIKGYAHAGRMHPVMDIFEAMCQQKEYLPNIRTFNTVLRGCLWVAATEKDGKIEGGVVTSEKAWKLFVDTVGKECLDSSSYEYSIVLLCQALRMGEANDRIEEFRKSQNIRLKGKATLSGGDQSSLESLAVAYLALARAYILYGEAQEIWKACQLALSAVRLSLAYLHGEIEPAAPNLKRKGVQGGKQGWKHDTEDDRNTERRLQSNIAYRKHRLAEIQEEAKALLEAREYHIGKDQLARRFITRLLYFSGGGTTGKTSSYASQKCLSTYFVPLWTSFGLSQLIGYDKNVESKLWNESLAKLVKKFHKIPLLSNERLDLAEIFLTGIDRPLDVELGAGFGDWIVQQAEASRHRNHIAVELRADRVHQIFSKAATVTGNGIDNLCVVGSDCGSFLRDRLPENCVSTFYVNHPEPPTQTYGDERHDLTRIIDGGEEPSHMLSSDSIALAARCLRKEGRIVIVTDNRYYARLLGATLVKVLRTAKQTMRSVDAKELKSYRVVESFPNGVFLFEGQPDATIGHIKSQPGGSYFDRLWRTGAGSHAETTKRFILVVKKLV